MTTGDDLPMRHMDVGMASMHVMDTDALVELQQLLATALAGCVRALIRCDS